MSRCLSERQIFALLDGSAGARAEARYRAHLSGCDHCAKAYATVEQIRRSLNEALPVAEPNWDKIDRGIERAIIDVTERPRPIFMWAPISLAAAAAALIALALLLPAEPDDPGAQQLALEQLPTVPEQAPPRWSPPETSCGLGCVVLDILGDVSGLEVGQQIAAGAEIVTGTGGGARLGIGDEVLVDVGESSHLELLALRSNDLAFGFHPGDFLISVPVGALERELVVLGDSAVFTMLSGVVKFYIGEDGLTIHVYEGELIADLGGGPTVLQAGTWQAVRPAARQLAGSWEALTITPLLTPQHDIVTTDELSEREIDEPTGTLPRRVIREAMERSKPSLRSCYETALKRYPKIDVSVTTRVSVGSRGQIKRVRVRGVEKWPELKGCLSGVFNSMSFPPPSGGPVDLILPLRLAPKE